MDDFIYNLSLIKSSNISKSDNNTFTIEICPKKEYCFKLLIPCDITEWFVTLYDKNSKELWSDWSEWYILGEVTKDNIYDFYKEDIRYFIDRIQSSSDFKIRKENDFKFLFFSFKGSNVLTGRINNAWKKLELGMVSDNFSPSSSRSSQLKYGRVTT